MNTLYLTAAEQAKFQTVSDALKDGWEVTPETIDAYETTYQLWIRANMMELNEFPEIKQMILALRDGKPVDPTTIQNIPDEALPEVLFTIGARGITILMTILFDRIESDEEIAAIAGLSHLRHDVLEANAKVPTPR